MDQRGEDKGGQVELGNLECMRMWRVGQAGREGGWEAQKSGSGVVQWSSECLKVCWERVRGVDCVFSLVWHKEARGCFWGDNGKAWRWSHVCESSGHSVSDREAKSQVRGRAAGKETEKYR